MATITTHPDGPYYKWRQSAIGSPPPGSFDEDTTCEGRLYHAWQHGVAKSTAANDYFNCLLSNIGGSIAGPPSGPDNLPTPIPQTGPGGGDQTPPPAAPAPPAPPAPPPLPSARPLGEATDTSLAHAASAYDDDQNTNIDTVITVGMDLKAPELAILACLCIGGGENNFHSEGCNGYLGCGCARGCCGFFQNDCAQQAQHDYHDVRYWAGVAYRSGLWVHGGIISIAVANPHYTPGYIANLCQGAYSDLQQGANYYDQFRSEAQGLYDARHGSYKPGTGTGASSVSAPTNPTTGGVFNLFDSLNWAGDLENLWKYVMGGSNEAAHMADDFNLYRLGQIDTIGWS